MRRWIVVVSLVLIVSLTAAIFFVHAWATEAHGLVAGYDAQSSEAIAAFLVICSIPLSLISKTRKIGFLVFGSAIVFYATFLAGIKLADKFNLIAWKNEPLVRVGPDVPASLVIYFKRETTNDEIEKFSQTVLSEPYVEGHGQGLKDGICEYLRVDGFQSTQGLKGIAINYCANATEAQREAIKQAVLTSPIVFRIYENIAPTEVKIP